MNPLAKALNEQIAGVNLSVLDMLSELGKNLFMPKGILSQSAEAKAKAHKYNATIGIASTDSGPMYLDCMYKNLTEFKPSELFPYAPSSGILALRQAWLEKMIKDNPLLNGKQISLPLVTNALTHGMSIVADMFADVDDYIILPDKYWGNYRMTFALRRGAEIVTYSTFTPDGKFNTNALLEKVKECGKARNKAIVVLNFPNNPTGYTPTSLEMNVIANGLTEIAESGVKVIAVADDAYFGLFFDDECFKESIFTLLTGRSANLMAVKLDGATKEEFAWGMRVGFITFGATGNGDQSAMLQALETKASGIIRATISNGPHISQSAVLKSLQCDEFYAQRAQCNSIIEKRCQKVKAVLADGRYSDEFTPYPFNSGYFMCIKLTRVKSEDLRVHLLDKYGVGVISTSSTDIRIAFSSVEEEHIADLFDLIYKGCKDL